MNERIREPYYSIMYKASEGWNDHLFQVPPELMEKLFEMIVRECALQCHHNDDMDRIEKHFGVEE